jgi:small subunit ribosomal protein S16
VAEVGNYNPHTKKTILDKEKVEFYLKNGAQPSSRVAFILKKNKIKLPDWYKETPKKQAKAKHADKLRKNQPKDAPAPAEAAPAEETPAEEAPAEAPAEEASTEAPAEEAPAEEAEKPAEA